MEKERERAYKEGRKDMAEELAVKVLHTNFRRLWKTKSVDLIAVCQKCYNNADFKMK